MSYRVFIIVFFLSLHISVFGKKEMLEQNENGFIIEAQIKDLPDDNRIFLLHRNNKTRKVDTAAVVITKNGQFVFKGKVDEAAEFYTILIDTGQYKFPKGKDNYFVLLLDNSTISLQGDIDSWPEINIEGSPSAIGYIEYLEIFSKKFDELQEYNYVLNKQNNDANRLLSIANQNNQKSETEILLKRIDSIKSLHAEAEASYQAAYIAYIEAHPDSYLTPHSIMQIENQLGVEKLCLQYGKLTARVKASLYGKQLKERIDELIVIKEKLRKKDVGLEAGKIAPDFTGQTFKGKQMSLYDICKSGKITLLDFWASWCKPCRAAFPDLKEVYKKYHDKGFNIVSLSTDKDLTTWKSASDTENLPWYDLTDVRAGKSFAEELYKIFKLPTTYLLDANGKIIEIDVDKKKLEEILEELLK